MVQHVTVECFDSTVDVNGKPYPPDWRCGEQWDVEKFPGYTAQWTTCPRCGCGWRVGTLVAALPVLRKSAEQRAAAGVTA